MSEEYKKIIIGNDGSPIWGVTPPKVRLEIISESESDNLSPKDKKESLSELERRLRALVVRGWEMGKEQAKEPLEYTCDTDIARNDYVFIKSLLEAEKKKAVEGVSKL